MLRTTFLPVLASFVLFACGGSVEKVPDPNGSTSPSTPTGGASGGSRSGGGGSSSGSASTGGSEEESQCDGLPNCNPGWTEVKGCVPDSECAKETTCGVSIICQKVDPTCEGVQPICDPGDKEIMASYECPQDAKCYTRANNCGFTIWCAKK